MWSVHDDYHCRREQRFFKRHYSKKRRQYFKQHIKNDKNGFNVTINPPRGQSLDDYDIHNGGSYKINQNISINLNTIRDHKKNRDYSISNRLYTTKYDEHQYNDSLIESNIQRIKHSNFTVSQSNIYNHYKNTNTITLNDFIPNTLLNDYNVYNDDNDELLQIGIQLSLENEQNNNKDNNQSEEEESLNTDKILSSMENNEYGNMNKNTKNIIYDNHFLQKHILPKIKSIHDSVVTNNYIYMNIQFVLKKNWLNRLNDMFNQQNNYHVPCIIFINSIHLPLLKHYNDDHEDDKMRCNYFNQEMIGNDSIIKFFKIDLLIDGFFRYKHMLPKDIKILCLSFCGIAINPEQLLYSINKQFSVNQYYEKRNIVLNYYYSTFDASKWLRFGDNKIFLCLLLNNDNKLNQVKCVKYKNILPIMSIETIKNIVPFKRKGRSGNGIYYSHQYQYKFKNNRINGFALNWNFLRVRNEKRYIERKWSAYHKLNRILKNKTSKDFL